MIKTNKSNNQSRQCELGRCNLKMNDSCLPFICLFIHYFQVMFEKYGFDGAYVAIQAVLTLYAQVITTSEDTAAINSLFTFSSLNVFLLNTYCIYT